MREAHWYHAGGHPRPTAWCAWGQRPRNAALGASTGLSGVAPRRGPRRQAPGARRHGRRSPRPGGASSRRGGVCPGLKRQWVAPELKLAAGGRERPHACRMPHALVQCAWAPRRRRGAELHSAASAQGGAGAPCTTVRPSSEARNAHWCATDSTCARQRGARGVRMSNTPFGSGGGRWGGVLAHMFAICSHRGAHAWRSDTLAPRAALRRDQGECGTWGGRLRPAARRARG